MTNALILVALDPKEKYSENSSDAVSFLLLHLQVAIIPKPNQNNQIILKPYTLYFATIVHQISVCNDMMESIDSKGGKTQSEASDTSSVESVPTSTIEDPWAIIELVDNSEKWKGTTVSTAFS